MLTKDYLSERFPNYREMDLTLRATLPSGVWWHVHYDEEIPSLPLAIYSKGVVVFQAKEV